MKMCGSNHKETYKPRVMIKRLFLCDENGIGKYGNEEQ